MFDPPIAAVVYCGFLTAFFLALWFYYDRRDHALFELERRKATFHCIRCDQLYTGPAGDELRRCPRCGHDNVRLRF